MRRGKSLVLKRSVNVEGHKTSLSLEDPFGMHSRKLLPLKERRSANSLQRSIANATSANKTILRPQFACLSSITIGG